MQELRTKYDSMGTGEAHNPTESLVRAAAAGEHRAFETLMRRYAPLISARVRGYAKSREHAEDLIQDVMVKAYCQLGNLRQPDRFGPWLSTLARNVARDDARRPQQPVASVEAGALLEEGSLGPRERAAQSEAEAVVLGAIDRLNGRQRDVVYLSLIEDLGSPQIAELLGLKESAVRMRLSKGIKNLRSLLTTRGYGPGDETPREVLQRKN